MSEEKFMNHLLSEDPIEAVKLAQLYIFNHMEKETLTAYSEKLLKAYPTLHTHLSSIDKESSEWREYKTIRRSDEEIEALNHKYDGLIRFFSVDKEEV